MSAESIGEFKRSITDRNNFVAELEAETTRLKSEGFSGDWNVQALINIGEKNGYSFTAEDISRALSEEELTDADLEQVGGGTGGGCWQPV